MISASSSDFGADAPMRRAATIAAMLALLVYLPNLWNDFAWDDDYLIVGNPSVHGFSHARSWFFEPWSAGSSLGTGREQNALYWRPLAQASYALDWSIGVWLSGRGVPLPFHVTNDALHALASLFVALLAGRLARDLGASRTVFGADVAALVAGCLYAVHPVHGEAVNLATYRTTLLSDAAVLGALWLHARRAHGLLVAAALAVGLMAKESALVLPGMLVVLDLAVRTKRSAIEHARAYVPVLLVMAAYLVIHRSVTGPPKLDFFAGATAGETAVTMFAVYRLYLGLLLVPWPLTSFYDWSIMPIRDSFTDPEALSGLVLFALTIAAGLWALWRTLRDPGPRRAAALILIGAGLLLVGLAPYTHLVTFFDLCGERFLHLAGAGPLIVAGIGVALSQREGGRVGRAVPWAVAAITMAFVSVTATRAPRFGSSQTMLLETSRWFPNSFNAHYGLGQGWIARAEWEKAAASFQAAHAILPDLDVAALSLADALARAGRDAEAIAFLGAEVARRGLNSGPLNDALEALQVSNK